MSLSEDNKKSLNILNNTHIVSDQMYKKLLEISLQDLIYTKTSDIKTLYGSKPDVIKELHAVILKSLLVFAHSNYTKEKALAVLTKDCRIESNRSKLFAEEYDKHKMKLIIKLGNIGTHLPHIVDVEWEIDFLIKSSALDSSQGPLFKVKLIVEQFDKICQGKKRENIVFWCTSQEMQDLVYKLEDAVRHCQKIANGH